MAEVKLEQVLNSHGMFVDIDCLIHEGNEQIGVLEDKCGRSAYIFSSITLIFYKTEDSNLLYWKYEFLRKPMI